MVLVTTSKTTKAAPSKATAPKKPVARKAPATKTEAAKPVVRRRVRKTATGMESPAQPVVLPDTDDAEGAVGSGGGMVLAAVPDKSVVDRYVHRVFPGNLQDFDLFDFARKSGMSMLIEGPTGPGKTMATRAWAASRGLLLARIPCHLGVEASQMFGKYVPDEVNGGFTWVDGPVTHVVRHGGVILINEVNFMPERISTVLFGLLDDNREIVLQDHKGEIIKAHRDLIVIADMNPDYAGTRPLNMAFRNRFAVQLQWDYDPVVEKRLIKNGALLTMAQQIRVEAAKGSYETPISTNMLMEFERVEDGLGLQFAFANLLNHFHADERPSLKLVIQTHEANIKRDFDAIRKPVKVEPEKPLDEGKGYDVRDNTYDPEWDVYGTDWVYADEA
jgi:hypothetical protein